MSKDLTSQIVEVMKEYSKTTSEEINEIMQIVSNEAKAKLNSTSPARSGKYRKGWRVKIERFPTGCKVHIHNTRYQLTHLLEKGHKSRGASFVPAQPHIAEVDAWAKKEAEKRIKEALSR